MSTYKSVIIYPSQFIIYSIFTIYTTFQQLPLLLGWMHPLPWTHNVTQENGHIHNYYIRDAQCHNFLGVAIWTFERNLLILKLQLLHLCYFIYLLIWTAPPEPVQCTQYRWSDKVAQHLTYHLILRDYLRKPYKLSKATTLLNAVSKRN